MPYIPSASNLNEPLASREVYTAAEEFRKIKAGLVNVAAEAAAELAAHAADNADEFARVDNDIAAVDGRVDDLAASLGTIDIGDSVDLIYVRHFSGDGSTATFTLPVTTPSKNFVEVAINGVIQSTLTYELSGRTLTLDTAPPVGTNNIQVKMAAPRPADTVGSKFVQRFICDGVTTTYTTDDYFQRLASDVYLDGVYQNKNTYSATGTGIAFTEAPHAGAICEIVSTGVVEIAGVTDANVVDYLPAGTGAVASTVQSKLREFVSRADYSSDSEFNTAKTGKLSIDSSNKLRATTFVAGTEELTGSASRDAFVVGRTVSGATDVHAFADRTVISSITDSGTYGSFDATTEYTAAGVINHLYTFQGRGKYSGSGTLQNYSSFYHQPTINGSVIDLHAVRVYDPAGTGTITNNHGVHIRPLTRGVNNFAVFSWGSTPSIHVGQWTFGNSTLDTTAAVAVETAGMTGFTQSGIRSKALGNSGALTSFSAFSGQVLLAPGSYTTPEGNGLRVVDAVLGAGVTLTTNVGVNIDDLTTGVNNVAMRSKVTAGATKWGLYFTGNAQNYLAGNLGLGVFQPTASLEIKAGTATNAPLKLTAGVSLTTPVNGTLEFDGTALYFTVGGVRKTVTLV